MKRQFKIITLFAFLIFNNINAQLNSKTEILTINWPKEEDWHIVDQQNNATGTMTTIVLLKGKETIANHNEIGTTYIYHGSLSVPIETEIEELYLSLKKYAPTAKKTIIEKDDKAKHPWIICKIESPEKSMIHYAIQGKNESYSNFWSTKQNEITPESQEKWVEIFKSSKIILE
ncbi:hypothetical protein [Flavobacterium hydrophilum]|uniref:Uncharacterized protein n=1 Tax=Flavobacterium hydrophilum TaxID=2211445 RepID=A0A2V4BZW3_9FLAO|nr:hypothetical protein [Flavobacterium hydrophilum]PXY44581.1 hypothetical protein DMB68_14040 [Flavobacterium hydrophilum]